MSFSHLLVIKLYQTSKIFIKKGIQITMNKLKYNYNIINNMIHSPLCTNHKIAAICRFMNWQFYYRFIKNKRIYTFVDNQQLIATKNRASSTGNYYCGLAEYEEMAFIRHFMQQSNGIFLDIGANIGSYTVLALGSSKDNYAISIEPSAETVSLMRNNISINDMEQRCEIHNVGAGAAAGSASFINNKDTVNRVLTDNESLENQEDCVITIPIMTVDEIIQNRDVQVMKIDVEGLEYDVLVGAKDTLASPSLHAIIVELIGCDEKYGHSSDEAIGLIMSNGFSQYTYNPNTRQLIAYNENHNNSNNGIFIRTCDLEFVTACLKDAHSFRVLKQNI